MASLIQFCAFDALWFREGRPFDQMDEGLSDARSVFPPSPATLAGALAAAFSPSVDGSVHPGLTELALGTEGNDEQLRFRGPFLATDTRLYIPAPATLLARTRKRGESRKAHQDALSKPSGLGVYLPDMTGQAGNQVRLPQQIAEREDDDDTFESLAKQRTWIDALDFFEHMASLFCFADKGLQRRVGAEHFVQEQRIGIGIDEKSRTAQEGELYAAQYLRPRRDPDTPDVRLAMIADGPSAEIKATFDKATVSLGGKGRFARLAIQERSLSSFLPGEMPGWRIEKGRVHFRITSVSPVPVDGTELGRSRYGLPVPANSELGRLANLRVEAALMPLKPTPIGIWNRLDKQSRARLVLCHQPGTTWFLSADLSADGWSHDIQRKFVERTLDWRLVPPNMLSLSAAGFGSVACGNWPTEKDMPSGQWR